MNTKTFLDFIFTFTPLTVSLYTLDQCSFSICWELVFLYSLFPLKLPLFWWLLLPSWFFSLPTISFCLCTYLVIRPSLFQYCLNDHIYLSSDTSCDFFSNALVELVFLVLITLLIWCLFFQVSSLEQLLFSIFFWSWSKTDIHFASYPTHAMSRIFTSG